MYNLYKINGNSAKALIYYEQYNQLSQKLASEDSKKAMLKFEYKLAYEKKEQELKLEQEKRDFIHRQEAAQKQNDLQKQKVITYAFMGGFVLLIALIYVVFRNLKQSKQANAIISEQKKEVELKNVLIETKQTEILDSINYAKRIQYTLLAHDEFLSCYLKDYFIYYQPKDIVSGDFYWATFHKERFYLAVCDSTGHGVPGAFMSLLNISFLNEAINEKGIEEPGPIFDHVRKRLMENMSREGQKDGFDGILVCFDVKDQLKNFRYAAANNAPTLISNGQIQQMPGDRMPVGIGERKESFKTYTCEVSKGDMLYFSTDGYADQFGGPRGKKFMNRRLNELLNEIADLSKAEQRKCLADAFVNWKGSVEQIDDVCVVGVRI
jgi:serine phosphatase RsbU (regulator of sigma subunit)